MSESTYLDRVRCDGKTPIARITLDHPPLNVLDRTMLEALSLCLNDLEGMHGLRCVILTGEGRAFVAGGDLTEYDGLTPEGFAELLRFAHAVYRRFERLPIPVIAAINGFAIGGGMELALACDIRIAAKSARIRFPEASIGLMPSYGGTARLGKLLAPGDAKYLIYSGRLINVDDALRMGLIQEIAEDDKLIEAAEALAEDIAAKSPVALRYVKQALFESITDSPDDALMREARYAFDVANEGDYLEGVAAFGEKRPPNFKDH